jgi:sodium bicarbonate transporter 10
LPKRQIRNFDSNNTHAVVVFVGRWVKFEEDVEEGGNRWSKPHVATLSLHSLFELRSMLLNGTICLDMSAYSLEDICDLALDSMVNTNHLPFEKKQCVKDAILKKHRHQVQSMLEI